MRRRFLAAYDIAEARYWRGYRAARGSAFDGLYIVGVFTMSVIGAWLSSMRIWRAASKPKPLPLAH